MSEFKPILERVRDRFVPPEDGLERLAARRRRKQRNQRVAAIVLALALLGGTSVGLWSALRPQPPSPASELVVALPGDALDIAVGGGSVWVLTCDLRCRDDGRRSEGSVVLVDPSTGRVVRSTTIMRPHAIAVGEGAVWVVDFWGSKVTRIDSETLRPVATVHLSLPYEVAPGDSAFVPSYISTGEGAVWVGTVRGAVAKIDPMTNEVADLIELAPDQPDDVAAGEGGVWVGVTPGIKQVDPQTGQIIGSIDLGIQPVTVQAADGSVWVEGEEVEWRSGLAPGYVSVGGRVLVGLDPATGAVETRIPLPSPSRVAVGTGVVWVADVQTGTLIAVDPVDGQSQGQPRFEGSGVLAANGKEVWVAEGRRVRKISFPPATPRPQPEAEGTGVCPTPSPGLYDPVAEPISGPVGTVVTISGAVPSYTEEGNYAGPSGKIQFWWNLDPELYWTALPGGEPSPDPSPSQPGDVVFLSEIDVDGVCDYQTQISVPDAWPGDYPIVALFVVGDGATPAMAMSFHVTG